MTNPVDASRYTKKGSVKTSRPCQVAMFTKWTLEKKQELTQNKRTVTEIMAQFKKDTGYKATHYTVKQIFGMLEVPVEKKLRWTKGRSRPQSSSKLDRLIKEVHILSERLATLSSVAVVTSTKGLNTEDFATTEGLSALRNRKGAPKSTLEESREEREDAWYMLDKDEETFS